MGMCVKEKKHSGNKCALCSYEEDKQKVAMSPMNRSVESGLFIKEIDHRKFMHYLCCSFEEGTL